MSYVIRIVLSFEQAQRIDTQGFIDLMAKAGIIKLHRNDRSGICMDLYPPPDVFAEIPSLALHSNNTEKFLRQELSREWAQRQSARLESAGILAAAAPEWKEGDANLSAVRLETRNAHMLPRQCPKCHLSKYPSMFDPGKINCRRCEVTQ